MLGAQGPAPISGGLPAAVLPVERPRRGLLRRRTSNRRVAVQRRGPLLLLADVVAAVGRRLLGVLRVLGKLVAVLGCLAAIVWGGRIAVRHVIASPRFAVTAIEVTETEHVRRDDVLALAGVREGDRLLALDTDAIAAAVAAHPWVAGARVERRLPSVLRIELAERRAEAVAALGGLYLVDERGRPFKRATLAEAEGLPVLTGLAREQYAGLREATEAAFREALALLEAYRARPERPAVSEVNLDVRFGLALFLLDGGAEIRVGRGDYGKKLARLDRILEAVKTGDLAGRGPLRVVHLDDAGGDRVPVGFADPPETPTETTTTKKKQP